VFVYVTWFSSYISRTSLRVTLARLTFQALVNFEAERVPLDAQTDASLAWRSRLLRLAHLRQRSSVPINLFNLLFLLIQPSTQALVNFEAERVPLDAQTDASLAWRSRLLRLAHLRQRSSVPIYIFNLLFLLIQPSMQALVNFEAERVPLDAQTDASLAWRSRLLRLAHLRQRLSPLSRWPQAGGPPVTAADDSVAVEVASCYELLAQLHLLAHRVPLAEYCARRALALGLRLPSLTPVVARSYAALLQVYIYVYVYICILCICIHVCGTAPGARSRWG